MKINMKKRNAIRHISKLLNHVREVTRNVGTKEFKYNKERIDKASMILTCDFFDQSAFRS